MSWRQHSLRRDEAVRSVLRGTDQNFEITANKKRVVILLYLQYLSGFLLGRG